jgi:cold shock CspA family protein
VIGKIKGLRETFGFIKTDEGPSYFFHFDDQDDDFELREGDAVTFDAVDPVPAKGPRAAHVALMHEVQP